MVQTPAKVPAQAQPIYMGVDPGASGGMAALQGKTVSFVTMPDEEVQVFRWLREMSGKTATQPPPCYAIIEEQSAGGFAGSSKGNVAKLYGSYIGLRMALAIADIRFYAVRATVWHRAMDIPPRKKSEARSEWKQRLKGYAEKLYPQLRITLATADALLIAEYCRRRFTK